MIFNGKIVSGKFVPDKSHETFYNSFIKRCEDGDIYISIDIKKAKRKSDRQANLFQAVLFEVAKATNTNLTDVIKSLSHLRIMDEESTEFVFKDFADYSTEEFSQFIDDAIDYLNDIHSLNLHVETINGKAKVCL